MINKNDVFADVANQLNYWVDTSLSAITEDNDDLRWTDNQNAFKNIRKMFSENKLEGALDSKNDLSKFAVHSNAITL